MMLPLLPPDYTYLEVETNEEECVVFRVKELINEKAALVWLQKLSEMSKATWRKSKTYPPKTGSSTLYKVDLRCQHASVRRLKRVRTSKQIGCMARMKITVKRSIPSLKNSEASLYADWPTLVMMKYNHNHSLDDPAALKYRDVSTETKEKLISLFHQGLDPASALHCLKTDLMLEYGEEYSKISCDNHYVPSPSIVYKMFEKEFSIQRNSSKGEEMFEALKNKLKKYNEEGGRAEFIQTLDGEHYFVVICTPIMSRVLSILPQSGELVKVEALGGTGKQMHRLCFFVTPTEAGELPIAAIVSNTDDLNIFEEALVELKSMLPSFNGNPYPKVILTDPNLWEKEALQRQFQESQFLHCQVHVLKSLWSWMSNARNNIDACDRQVLYDMVKNVLYSHTEDFAVMHHNMLTNSNIFQKYHHFRQHYNELWVNRHEWALYCRLHLPLGETVINYVEIVFGIMKHCILKRVTKFDLNYLVDFILTRFEFHLKQRLLDFYHGRYSKSVLKTVLPKVPDMEMEIMTRDTPGSFEVCDTSSQKRYTVDIVTGICSCVSGQAGKICEHAAAILLTSDGEIYSAFGMTSEQTKQNMLNTALGEVPIDYQEENEAVENVLFEVEPFDATPTHTFSLDNSNSNTEPPSPHLELLNEFEVFHANFRQRIREGIHSNPDNYVPAVKEFLENANKHALNECGLLSALRAFAAPKADPEPNQNRPIFIKIQASPPAKSSVKLPIKRKLSPVNTKHQIIAPQALQSHNYVRIITLQQPKGPSRDSDLDNSKR